MNREQNISQARQNVIEAGNMLVKKGLVARTWGNISARVSDDQFVITPSGRAYDTLTEDQIILVNIDDGDYEGDIKPSSEKGIHADIYKLREDASFIIHTHQKFASAISISGSDIEVTDKEASSILGKTVPCAKYGLSSTEKLRKNVVKAFKENPNSDAILMHSHGAICIGEDMDEAFEAADMLEEISKDVFEVECGFLPEDDFDEENCRIIKRGMNGEMGEQFKRVFTKANKSAILVSTPLLVKISQEFDKMLPYLDDQAQIVGTSVNIVDSDASSVEIRDAIDKNNAVFLRGIGAIAIGPDEDEAMAVCQVLDKAAAAACYAKAVDDAKPLGLLSAGIERAFYMKNYSKRKK